MTTTIPAGWKQISSAPKDELIIVGPTKRMGICVAMNHSQEGWVTETRNGWCSIYAPTHWMPLPAEPTASADAVPTCPWSNVHPDCSAAPTSAQEEAKDAAQIARWKRDSELLMAIQESCWDVRFLGHSNGDDCDISIEIVGHYMAAPRERVMGENYTENLRAALEQAMTAEAYPPARPERPAPAAGDAQTAAARDVSAERQRQISAEGWTPEHDDEHSNGEIAYAATSYAVEAAHLADGMKPSPTRSPPFSWPPQWDTSWWKPSDTPRRNLVKAGALILAEIERLDRAAQQGKGGEA